MEHHEYLFLNRLLCAGIEEEGKKKKGGGKGHFLKRAASCPPSISSASSHRILSNFQGGRGKRREGDIRQKYGEKTCFQTTRVGKEKREGRGERGRNPVCANHSA